jgi:hypothetical protein
MTDRRRLGAVSRRHYTLREGTQTDFGGPVIVADHQLERLEEPEMGTIIRAAGKSWRIVSWLHTESSEAHSNTLVVERVT